MHFQSPDVEAGILQLSRARFGTLEVLRRRRGGVVRKVLFIFSVLTDGDVEWLAKAGQRVHVEPGAVLIAVGSQIDYLYFVLEGRLAIKTRSGDPIALLQSGEIIGHKPPVDPPPPPAPLAAVPATAP